MHGVVFTGLREFVVERTDRSAWDRILEAADLEDRKYLEIDTYPDEEAVAIVETAADLTGASGEKILRSYGAYLARDLVSTYDSFLRDEWGPLDVLEHTETAMHKAVRLEEDDADPPELSCRRPSEDRVVIEYTSDLELCKLGEGIIAGVGAAYDTPLRIGQTECKLEGDGHCEIHATPRDRGA